MNNILFDYTFILTDWHIVNIPEIFKDYMSGYLFSNKIIQSINNIIIPGLKTIYMISGESEIKIVISKNNNEISIYFDLKIEENKKSEIYKILQKELINNLITINKNIITKKGIKIIINDEKSKNSIKQFTLISLSIKTFSLTSLIVFCCYTFFKLSKFNIIILIILSLFNLLYILIENYLILKKLKQKSLDNINVGKINQKIDFLYSIFLANQNKKENIKKWQEYIQNINYIKNDIFNKSRDINNLLSIEIETKSKCIDLVNTISTTDLENIDTINISNNKIVKSSKSILNLLSSITSNVDEEVNSSKQTVNRIKNTEEYLNNSMSVAEALFQNSSYIEQFMKTIEDISDKIHLLSMNASITAARSGNAGKPFMVVAKEIGKLSDDVKSSIIDMKNKSNILKSLIIKVEELITNVNNEIKSTYNDITSTIEKFEGIYLSLNVIDKKSDVSMTENIRLLDLLSTNFSKYKENHLQILNSLNLNELDNINKHFQEINTEINNIEKIIKNSMNEKDVSFSVNNEG